MNDVVQHLNDAAQVLGYFVLVVWAIAVIVFAVWCFQELRFEWRKKRREEEEQYDNGWVLDMQEDVARHDTDVLDLGASLQQYRDEAPPRTRPYLAVNNYRKERRG